MVGSTLAAGGMGVVPGGLEVRGLRLGGWACAGAASWAGGWLEAASWPGWAAASSRLETRIKGSMGIQRAAERVVPRPASEVVQPKMLRQVSHLLRAQGARI